MILELLKIFYFSIIIFITVILFSLIIDNINHKLIHDKINIYVDIFITWMLLMIGLYIIKYFIKKIPFFVPVNDDYYINDNSFIFLFSICIILISTTQNNMSNNLKNIHKNFLGF